MRAHQLPAIFVTGLMLMIRPSLTSADGGMTLTTVNVANQSEPELPANALAQSHPGELNKSEAESAGPLSLDSVGDEPTTQAEEHDTRAYGIGGPWRLRSADAVQPGQLSIRNELNWITGVPSGDDETFYGLSIDYGIAPMHHVTLELPVEIGDGAVTGNGDFRLGWHWQLMKEEDWKPSFAIRNYVRIPSGHESSGVDYELRGLFSKSVSDRVRVHFGPFLESVNGNNIEDARHFQWGAAIGSDWRITDTLDMVIDYVHESSDLDHFRNQHSLDLGFIWEIKPNHKIGINGRCGLDGDDVNGNWGAGIFYTIALDGLSHLGDR